MLDSKITELAGTMIRIQFDERSEQLKRDIEVAQNRLAMQGLGTSGAVIQAVQDLCARDIEIRALIVWQNLGRVLANAGVHLSETLADDLKREVLMYQSLIYDNANNRLQTVVQNVGIGMAASLTESRDRALAKVNAEIDLFVLSLQRAKAQSEKANSSQTNVYVNSPVGVIQTGPSATATIVQTLTSEDRNALLNALKLVKEGIDPIDNLPTHPKEEVVELVAEAQTEVEKPRPNNTRLLSIFMTVATAIQTVGSLQPAYQALKTALLPLGIALP